MNNILNILNGNINGLLSVLQVKTKELNEPKEGEDKSALQKAKPMLILTIVMMIVVVINYQMIKWILVMPCILLINFITGKNRRNK